MQFSSVETDRISGAGLANAGVKQAASTITASSAIVGNEPSKFFLMNSASAQVLNLPAGLTGWDIGSVVTVIQRGAGAVAITPATNVKINGVQTAITTGGQNKVVSLINVGVDDWVATGSFS